MSYKLPILPYNYNALEPYFDEKTMKIHHTKHHQAYIDNVNKALKNTKFENFAVDDLIKILNQIPEDKKNIVRNNLGGHLNHSIFWKGLKKSTVLKDKLQNAIEENFSSIDSFKKEFENKAIARFGSGWVWLVKKENNLDIVSTANQDNPLMGEKIAGVCGFPIIGLDLWEHAYYLKYYNKRIDYIKAFWSVVNWDEAEKRFLM